MFEPPRTNLAARTRTPPRVLVVEDSPTDLALMLRLVERLECEADVARDGEAALAAVRRGGYDFILMDLQLPHLDGWEATKAIHEAVGPAGPFIAAVTGHHDAESLRRAEAVGVDYVIHKPATLAAVRAMLAPSFN